MTKAQRIAFDIKRNLDYLHPSVYYSKSGSVYIFLPHGVVRVSEHDTQQKIKWKVFPSAYKCTGRRCYGKAEIGAMICDIKHELAHEEFAGRFAGERHA